MNRMRAFPGLKALALTAALLTGFTATPLLADNNIVPRELSFT